MDTEALNTGTLVIEEDYAPGRTTIVLVRDPIGD